MDLNEFNKLLNEIDEPQVDMFFWRFTETKKKRKKSLKSEIKVGKYNSSKVVPFKFNKLIRL